MSLAVYVFFFHVPLVSHFLSSPDIVIGINSFTVGFSSELNGQEFLV